MRMINVKHTYKEHRKAESKRVSKLYPNQTNH